MAHLGPTIIPGISGATRSTRSVRLVIETKIKAKKAPKKDTHPRRSD